MKVEEFINVLDADFFVGVPDSQLKALCNFLYDEYGNDEKHHIVAANEGNAAAIAAGYHLATGKTPVVYMQNSGEGNIINPLASLLNKEVYGIPIIFIIGWRGEPGVHDEPQHIYQGKVTKELMEIMDVASFVIDGKTQPEELKKCVEEYRAILKDGKDVCFIVRKDGLTYDGKKKYVNEYSVKREEIIRRIVSVSQNDPIISTTGKTSRELFEIREAQNSGHMHDFLTVGSMGHSSSIALGVALNSPNEHVWCIDGDGAALMHMGSMAVIGAIKPHNMIHIVINNESHESVGGMPTVAKSVDFVGVAKACGYQNVVLVEDIDDLEQILAEAREKKELTFVEIKSAIGSRDDLGRPTIPPNENKKNFMNALT